MIGGTLNGDGRLDVEATAVGEQDRRWPRSCGSSRQAQASKPPIQRLADRISGVFVPVVLGIAVVTWVVWYVVGPEPRALFATVALASVLIIACPCALGLATPDRDPRRDGPGRADGHPLPQRRRARAPRAVTLVLLDKTGTITEGPPRLTDRVHVAGVPDDELLGLAAALEEGSAHPLARAVVAAARAKGIALRRGSRGSPPAPGSASPERCGGRASSSATLGSSRSEGIDISAVRDELARFASEGKTPLLVGADGRLLGVLAVADPREADFGGGRPPSPQATACASRW